MNHNLPASSVNSSVIHPPFTSIDHYRFCRFFTSFAISSHWYPAMVHSLQFCLMHLAGAVQVLRTRIIVHYSAALSNFLFSPCLVTPSSCNADTRPLHFV
ncbi:hypothetical protein CRM22_006533 [Opisthorchis felineus]|uniref:Uncharacterized protein n=1 Tax=Opisthorchis felineus TaxID=147828 RepID=A0A4S2LT84_OPIFE|nr:hypothetical protein CRM22_006533 [Opisthorchis felineus]